MLGVHTWSARWVNGCRARWAPLQASWGGGTSLRGTRPWVSVPRARGVLAAARSPRAPERPPGSSPPPCADKRLGLGLPCPRAPRAPSPARSPRRHRHHHARRGALPAEGLGVVDGEAGVVLPAHHRPHHSECAPRPGPALPPRTTVPQRERLGPCAAAFGSRSSRGRMSSERGDSDRLGLAVVGLVCRGPWPAWPCRGRTPCERPCGARGPRGGPAAGPGGVRVEARPFREACSRSHAGLPPLSRDRCCWRV